MKLIIQPEAGVMPIVTAIRSARKKIDVFIFRIDQRAIIRDGTRAFVGSQGLRKEELDRRREVGLIITNPTVARKLLQVFESDWAISVKSSKAKEAA